MFPLSSYISNGWIDVQADRIGSVAHDENRIVSAWDRTAAPIGGHAPIPSCHIGPINLRPKGEADRKGKEDEPPDKGESDVAGWARTAGDFQRQVIHKLGLLARA